MMIFRDEDCRQSSWPEFQHPWHPVQTVTSEVYFMGKKLQKKRSKLCNQILALFSASSKRDSASSKRPICMQQTAFPFRISPVI